MFPHRIQILGHTFNPFFSEGQVRGNAFGSRGDWRSDHGSGSVSELAGGLLQRFPTRADLFFNVNATIVENDHGSGSVSESQGGRIPDVDFGGRASWKPMRNYDYPCRKAKAAGSNMLISGDQHMVTQQAFEPLVKQDSWKKQVVQTSLTRHAC